MLANTTRQTWEVLKARKSRLPKSVASGRRSLSYSGIRASLWATYDDRSTGYTLVHLPFIEREGVSRQKPTKQANVGLKQMHPNINIKRNVVGQESASPLYKMIWLEQADSYRTALEKFSLSSSTARVDKESIKVIATPEEQSYKLNDGYSVSPRYGEPARCLALPSSPKESVNDELIGFNSSCGNACFM